MLVYKAPQSENTNTDQWVRDEKIDPDAYGQLISDNATQWEKERFQNCCVPGYLTPHAETYETDQKFKCKSENQEAFRRKRADNPESLG